MSLIKLALLNKDAGLADIIAPSLKAIRANAGVISHTPLHKLPTSPGLLTSTTMALTGQKPRTFMQSGAKLIDNTANKIEGTLSKLPSGLRRSASILGNFGLNSLDLLI